MANKLITTSLVVAVMAATMLPSPVAQAKSYLDEMATLDAQIALLNKRAELRNAMQNQNTSLELPSIASIIDDANGASAKLVYPNGIIRWVVASDDIGDGAKITSITRNRVVARVGKKTISLPFATASMLSAGEGGAAASGGMQPNGTNSGNTMILEGQAPSIQMPPLPSPARLPVPVAPTPMNESVVTQ